MNFLIFKKQQGVGLMEVLITTVVVAVGLLAVASLQGDFAVSSADSKARAEAQVLAEKKIEMLRNHIIAENLVIDGTALYPGYVGGFTSVDMLTDSDEITGVNAVFDRSWAISQGGTPDRKKVSVLVTWDSDGAVDGDGNPIVSDDERINIVTEMVFVNPAKSARYTGDDGSGGTGAVPSPRQNASEDINAASEDVIGTDLQITAVGDGDGTAGSDQQVQVNPDGTLLTLSQVASDSFFYTAAHSDYPAKIEAGVIAVFLCYDADNDPLTTDTCTHIQNHFGGVVHRVKGTVYSTSGEILSDRSVAWTSSETHACYNGPVTTGTGIDEMPYECVYAGNCNATTEGTRTASSGGLPHAVDEGCFEDDVVSDDQINARNVGPGGEYGDIGLLGLASQGPNSEQVCFLENTAAIDSPLLDAASGDAFNENYLYAVTKRFYVTRRLKRNGSINDHKNEGINRSYTNHNLFIADRRTGPSVKTECREQVLYSGREKEVAPREISRALNEGTDNAVFNGAAYAGGTGVAQTLIGNVTGSATKLRLFIPELGTCYLNNNLEDIGDEATAYACVIGSAAAGAQTQIIGSSNEHKNLTPSVFSECARDVNTDPGCHWLSDFTNTYNDGGVVVTSCTTPWGAEVADTGTVPAYSITDCNTAVTRTCTSGTLGGDSTAIYQTTTACDTVANAGASCELWVGTNLIDGATGEVNSVSSVPYGSTCPTAISVLCDDGTLYESDGTTPYTGEKHQNCTVDAPCLVPNIIGESTNNAGQVDDVNLLITLEGLLVTNGTGTEVPAGSGESKEVFEQNPAGGTPVACGSNVAYSYRQ